MDFLEQDTTYQQPKEPINEFNIQPIMSKNEEHKKTGVVRLWLIAMFVVFGATGALFGWSLINQDEAFSSEVRVDTAVRALQAQQLDEESEESTEDIQAKLQPDLSSSDDPVEVIDLGGQAEVDLGLDQAKSVLMEASLNLGEDLDCGYFNHYFELARTANQNGLEILPVLREPLNNLVYDTTTISSIPDILERTDFATTTREKLTALVLVISVVQGDTRNETAPLCQYQTGDVILAANSYLKQVDILIEQQRARGGF